MPARSPEIMPLSVNTLFRMVKRWPNPARITAAAGHRFRAAGHFARRAGHAGCVGPPGGHGDRRRTGACLMPPG
ncbi:hypothetical protein OH687_26245 [Burkholderia anthina]|nr:hypothetical protein OH687_26245 [Burkholderia anthina]